MNDQNEALVATFGEDLFDDLFEALCDHVGGRRRDERFRVLDMERHERLNYDFRVAYRAPDGGRWTIIGRNGNSDGSVIEEFFADEEKVVQSVVRPTMATETQEKLIDGLLPSLGEETGRRVDR